MNIEEALALCDKMQGQRSLPEAVNVLTVQVRADAHRLARLARSLRQLGARIETLERELEFKEAGAGPSRKSAFVAQLEITQKQNSFLLEENKRLVALGKSREDRITSLQVQVGVQVENNHKLEQHRKAADLRNCQQSPTGESKADGILHRRVCSLEDDLAAKKADLERLLVVNDKLCQNNKVRGLQENLLRRVMKKDGSYSVIIEDIPESIELLEPYEGLKFVVPFLDDLQDFHDDSVNWDLLGLTTTGETTYRP